MVCCCFSRPASNGPVNSSLPTTKRACPPEARSRAKASHSHTLPTSRLRAANQASSSGRPEPRPLHGVAVAKEMAFAKSPTNCVPSDRLVKLVKLVKLPRCCWSACSSVGKIVSKSEVPSEVLEAFDERGPSLQRPAEMSDASMYSSRTKVCELSTATRWCPRERPWCAKRPAAARRSTPRQSSTCSLQSSKSSTRGRSFTTPRSNSRTKDPRRRSRVIAASS
mmetsp:Transcript_35543/g.110550  ORF Transcript_35543/g.110550 Transcript_35543/m.110550 type:complete len:223 (-) Transcript_35543:437-1105(-)